MNQLPGQRDILSTTPRDCLYSPHGAIFARGVIDSTYAYDGSNTTKEDEIRAGTPLARITSSKLWVACKRTTIAVGSSSASVPSAAISVVDARAFKAGDTITVNATTGCTISSVNYSTNVITLSAALDVDLAVGNPVFASGSLAGAEICRGILNETIRLLDDKPYGTLWYDRSFSMLVVHGFVNPDLILGDIAAIRAATNHLNGIVWADEQGQT
jgi:hypothetical protein